MNSDAGIVLIVVLIVLLIERDVVRTLRSSKADLRWQTLDIAVAPLFLVFVAVIVARMVELGQ